MNIFKRFSQWLEYQSFLQYQAKTIRLVENANISPLVKFPFLVWLELELPDFYKEHGARATEEAVQKKPREIADALQNSIAQMLDAKPTPWDIENDKIMVLPEVANISRNQELWYQGESDFSRWDHVVVLGTQPVLLKMDNGTIIAVQSFARFREYQDVGYKYVPRQETFIIG